MFGGELDATVLVIVALEFAFVGWWLFWTPRRTSLVDDAVRLGHARARRRRV
jgi:hypothetical protein